MAKPFDMKFIAHDPFADKDAGDGARHRAGGAGGRCSAAADFLSVSCPLTPETRHIVNAERLALMKPTAYLINTARGPIVDQKALTEGAAGRGASPAPGSTCSRRSRRTPTIRS